MRLVPFARSLGAFALLAAAAAEGLAQDPPAAAGSTPPREPTRVAQYPLENDPYEGPPQGPLAPSYNTGDSPQQSSPRVLATPQEEPWIVWESTSLSGTFLQETSEGLGWGDVVGKSTIKFPQAPFVWISPQIGAHYLSDTGQPNVPSHVYDASLEIAGGMPLGEKWIFQGGISPGLFSDFEGAGGDVFRLPFRVMMFYKWSEILTIGGGVLYLDRPDVNALPLIGLSYIPDDEFRAELWFPRPKVSWRYQKDGDVERWVYVLGEFGGGSWAIRDDNGLSDNFAYRDLRLMVGVEQKNPQGLGWFMEGGYIFNRQITFERTNQETDLDSTAGVQAGIRF